MISDYGLWNSEPSYYMIEKEEGGSLTILCICSYSLTPLSEIIHSYNNVTMPLDRGRITMRKLNTPFGKRANDNDGV